MYLFVYACACPVHIDHIVSELPDRKTEANSSQRLYTEERVSDSRHKCIVLFVLTDNLWMHQLNGSSVFGEQMMEMCSKDYVFHVPIENEADFIVQISH